MIFFKKSYTICSVGENVMYFTLDDIDELVVPGRSRLDNSN